jgi:uroporphyrin-III C-methyltransferase
MTDAKKPGFVSFVSSGPGDPDLMTVKAVRHLAEADAVLYDDLSAGPILSLARPGADLVGVGKRAGRASPKQDHVSQLLVDYAKTGQKVVRLKSGDAGIFGRLEEEITALTEAGIGYEIIPGVTTPSAAAAARRLQFITAADVTGGLPGDLNWAALADPHATTCVFMGKRTFGALVAGLLAQGMPADTPALLAESVGHADERLWRGTITSLAAKLAEDVGSFPAVILYGALADLPEGWA